MLCTVTWVYFFIWGRGQGAGGREAGGRGQGAGGSRGQQGEGGRRGSITSLPSMAEMNLPTNIKLSCLLIFYRFFIQQDQFLIAQKIIPIVLKWSSLQKKE